jgi:hypothetical protein
MFHDVTQSGFPEFLIEVCPLSGENSVVRAPLDFFFCLLRLLSHGRPITPAGLTVSLKFDSTWNGEILEHVSRVITARQIPQPPDSVT